MSDIRRIAQNVTGRWFPERYARARRGDDGYLTAIVTPGGTEHTQFTSSERGARFPLERPYEDPPTMSMHVAAGKCKTMIDSILPT